jgi:DNA-binding LacI/PurR family transcriptional regulator
MGIERKKGRATHRDVARRANVSTAVVSYVINDGPRPTSPEVRARVLQAIEELDYHPNAVARGLRAQRTQTIGFVVNSYYPLEVFASPYSSGILTGLATELKAEGYYLLIYPMVIGEDLGPLRRLLRSRRVDGVVVRLIQDTPASDDLMEVIAATDIPCVCIERPCAAHFNVKSVTYDDALGAYTATHHLFEKGHRRIAHLCGDLRYATAQARLQGYRRAVADLGMRVDEQLIQGNTWDRADAMVGMRQLLALVDPPTAVFAANDSLAFTALDVLRAHQKLVPGDIAVIGFDDTPLARQASPPLTTVRVPLVDLGCRAAELMLCLIEGDDGAESETLPVELILRGTA